jgi:chorismate-pyruvate lyase
MAKGVELKPIESTDVELSQLVSLFYSDENDGQLLGQFDECSAEQLPDEYRQLLAHEHHMTVTVEAIHQSSIELEVLADRHNGHFYSRKIVLRRTSDGRAVLFGIVRIDLSVLDPDVRQAIEAKQTPLGQVLIDHEVLRQVKLVGLYRIQPGTELETVFSPTPNPMKCAAIDLDCSGHQDNTASHDTALYGRTALIYCDNRSVIELLEIVAV